MRPRVLLVDDEPAILEALSLALGRPTADAPEIETVTSAKDALDRLAAGAFAMVIADYRMPGMDGVELLEKVRADYPQTVRGLLTGFHDLDIAVAASERASVHYYLQKPWDTEELREVVREAVRGAWKTS
ncbi:MAG TPA: response regulator [Candidatus Thermoplasmatota archaeon]|nr:response regulator [Candidatus Thermoplasmatota archaeon]